MERLPRVSGESGPNISVISARFDSRLMEWVAPMASRFRPRSRAKGSARKMVPRFPISWKISAGPAESTTSMLAPALIPSLAIKGQMATMTSLDAAFTSFFLKIFSASGPERIPRIRA